MKSLPGWDLVASRHPLVVYSVARLVVFVVVLSLLYVAGARRLLLLVLAFLVSSLLSYVFLRGQRDHVTAALDARSRRVKDDVSSGRKRRSRLDAAASSEDDD